ncbi:class I SAM-dependent methyltransferase [Virgisporangium ochraceum]|uniref:Methyltransferase n=1 Tax=Virgisporangium ochraceum TaxID=65505 RepID=A0A8J4EFN3_9ACTN|nr:class I SAM-dependent methyltransferase [Virgisporangium ochraceum]GIJ73014.1 methyltransferase [Virgisporangium ochraceum]
MDHVRDAYSAIADRYIDLFGTVGQTDPDDLAFVERHLTIRPGTVIDLGCGPGHLTGFLRSLGVDAVGVDPVPEFIAHARAAHPDGAYRLGSLETLGAAGYAGILAWFSLIHLPPSELDGALATLRSVTAPGGTLVLGYFESDEVGPFDHKVTTAYRWPTDEISRRLQRAGFAEVDHLHRPADGTHRDYGAIAATYV